MLCEKKKTIFFFIHHMRVSGVQVQRDKIKFNDFDSSFYGWYNLYIVPLTLSFSPHFFLLFTQQHTYILLWSGVKIIWPKMKKRKTHKNFCSTRVRTHTFNLVRHKLKFTRTQFIDFLLKQRAIGKNNWNAIKWRRHKDVRCCTLST
jgi:hypothetical protein